MKRISWGAGALLLAVLAGSALAQTPATPTDEALEEAKGHFEKANDLYARQLYTEAAIEFVAAYDAKPLPAFLYNAGVAYEKSKNIKQAIELFKRYLRENPTAQDKAKLEKRVADLEKSQTGTTEPDPENPENPEQPKTGPVLPPIETRGIVNVETKPPGAKIYLDNKRIGALGTAPWSASLEGEHLLIIEAKGFKPETKKISPSADKILEVYIALSKEDYLGWLEVVSSRPGAEIFIDDKAKGAIGKTPYTGFLKPGKHTLWIERQGYEPIKKTIDIAAGKAHEHRVNLQPIAYGFVQVRAAGLKGAMLYIDGKKTCEVPCRSPIDAGKRRISVRKGGRKSYGQTIEVTRASSTDFKVALAPKPSRLDAYLTLFASAAFAGGGIFFGKKSNDTYDELEKDIAASVMGMGPPVDSNDPRYDEGKRNAYIADGLYALSGVTFLLGTYYLFRDKGSSSKGVYASESLVRAPAPKMTLSPVLQAGANGGLAGAAVRW